MKMIPSSDAAVGLGGSGLGSFLSPWSPFSTLDVRLIFIAAPRVYSVSCFIMAEAS
jgi:hypothetical protein